MSRLNVLESRRGDEEDEQEFSGSEEDQYSDSEVESEAESEAEKDESEEELERLVFGDRAGFRDGLSRFRPDTDEGEDDQGLTGLEGLDDSQVGQTLNRKRRVYLYLTDNSCSSPIQELRQTI